MADKLVVIEAQSCSGMPDHGVCLAWLLDEDGDIGYVVGTDSPQPIAGIDDADDALTSFAEEEARQFLAEHQNCVYVSDVGAIIFEVTKDAKAVLAKAKVRLASWKSKKPWPEWAIQAKAAGWKMPKTWKP